MSIKETASLTSVEQQIIVGGRRFMLSPLNIGRIGKIERHFADRGGYQGAVEAIVTKNDFDTAIEFIYNLISWGGEREMGLDEFKKISQPLIPAYINSILAMTFTDSTPEFSMLEDPYPTSKKKVVMGWTVILLAIAGLIHSVSWLLSFIFHGPIF